MMSINFNKIRDLIKSNDIEGSLHFMDLELKQSNQYDNFLLIQSDYIDLQDKEVQGIIDYQNYQLILARIKKRILSLLSLVQTLENSRSNSRVAYTDYRKIRGKSIQEIKTLSQLLKSMDDNEDLTFELSICYLHLHLFDLTIQKIKLLLQKNPECSDYYYFLAIAKIRGRILKLIPHGEIKEITDYLDTAIGLEPQKGEYYLLYTIIILDYFLLNKMKTGYKSTAIMIEAYTKAKKDNYETLRLSALIPIKNTKILSHIESLNNQLK